MRALFEQLDKLVDFPDVRRGKVKERDGTTVVGIFDPTQLKEEFETDAFTSWDRIPGLKALAIASYIRAGTKPSISSHMTRKQMAALYRQLAGIMLDAGLDDRTPSTLTYFDCEDIISFVAAKEHQRPGQLLMPLREMVAEIYRDPELNRLRNPHLFVRKDPFPGQDGRRTREILPEPLFGEIYARAADDCARIMRDVRSFRARLAKPVRGFPSDERNIATAEECAVWVHERFGDRLPQMKLIRGLHPSLFTAVMRVGGWKEVVPLIHPTVRQLMPFMGLLGCQTLFNKAVMTEFGFKDIARRDVAGTLRLVMTPVKERAGRLQLRSFQIDDSSDNPDVIVRFLREYTSGLAGMVDPRLRDRVFLFWSLANRALANDAPGAAAFFGPATGSGSEDSRFSHAWKAWCEDHGLGDIPFSALRVTGLNLAHRAFGGDVRAIEALASHSGVDVFEQDYKSAQARARDDHRMARAMLLRERLLASSGKVDPTRRLRGEGVQGATPGFGCLEPCSSPVPGQRIGRPCSAYGMCPGCPLATTDASVPANLVRMKQLEAEYVAAANYLAPHYWRDKYLPELVALRAEWLPVFDDPEVIRNATAMQTRPLPPLG